MKCIISFILLTLSVSLFADQWRGIAVTSEDIPDNMILFNRAAENETVIITSIDSGKSYRARVGGKAEDSKYVALLSQNVAQELNIDGNAAEIVIDTGAAAILEENPPVIPAQAQLYEILPPYVQNLPTIGQTASGSAYRRSINDIPLYFHSTDTEKKAVNWVDTLERGKVYIKIVSSTNKNELENYSKTIAMFFNDSIILYESADLRYELLLGPINENCISQSIRIVRDYGYKDAYLIRGK